MAATPQDSSTGRGEAIAITIDAGLWHLSAACNHTLGYYELKEIRYTFLPNAMFVAQVFPPREDFVNVHENYFTCGSWHQAATRNIKRRTDTMPGKIALNGFGRLGRLALMAQIAPLISQKADRLFKQGLESLKEVVADTNRRSDSLRMYPTADIRVLSMKPPESIVTDVLVDTSGLPNARYHDRTFPKDYAKKKKAKRRQQKQARRKNK